MLWSLLLLLALHYAQAARPGIVEEATVQPHGMLVRQRRGHHSAVAESAYRDKKADQDEANDEDPPQTLGSDDEANAALSSGEQELSHGSSSGGPRGGHESATAPSFAAHEFKSSGPRSGHQVTPASPADGHVLLSGGPRGGHLVSEDLREKNETQEKESGGVEGSGSDGGDQVSEGEDEEEQKKLQVPKADSAVVKTSWSPDSIPPMAKKDRLEASEPSSPPVAKKDLFEATAATEHDLHKAAQGIDHKLVDVDEAIDTIHGKMDEYHKSINDLSDSFGSLRKMAVGMHVGLNGEIQERERKRLCSFENLDRMMKGLPYVPCDDESESPLRNSGEPKTPAANIPPTEEDSKAGDGPAPDAQEHVGHPPGSEDKPARPNKPEATNEASPAGELLLSSGGPRGSHLLSDDEANDEHPSETQGNDDEAVALDAGTVPSHPEQPDAATGEEGKVTIKLQDGRRKSYASQTTVRDLKEKIQAELQPDVPVEWLKLLFEGRQLTDDRRVDDLDKGKDITVLVHASPVLLPG